MSASGRGSGCRFRTLSSESVSRCRCRRRRRGAWIGGDVLVLASSSCCVTTSSSCVDLVLVAASSAVFVTQSSVTTSSSVTVSSTPRRCLHPVRPDRPRSGRPPRPASLGAVMSSCGVRARLCRLVLCGRRGIDGPPTAAPARARSAIRNCVAAEPMSKFPKNASMPLTVATARSTPTLIQFWKILNGSDVERPRHPGVAAPVEAEIDHHGQDRLPRSMNGFASLPMPIESANERIRFVSGRLVAGTMM